MALATPTSAPWMIFFGTPDFGAGRRAPSVNRLHVGSFLCLLCLASLCLLFVYLHHFFRVGIWLLKNNLWDMGGLLI